MFTEADQQFMQQAIALARQAEQQSEVPVGAVLVLNNEVIGSGYNQSIRGQDPSAHAEMIALREGANKIGNYRLINTTLYVTLEPCMMCAGAMVHARIGRLVYGASDSKTGVINSVANLLGESFHNHKIACRGGLLSAECGDILSQFFRRRRTDNHVK